MGSSSGEGQLLRLTIPLSSFSPLPTFDDASTSQKFLRFTHILEIYTLRNAHTIFSFHKYRHRVSYADTNLRHYLGGCSFSDSEPPCSANARMPTAALLSYPNIS